MKTQSVIDGMDALAKALLKAQLLEAVTQVHSEASEVRRTTALPLLTMRVMLRRQFQAGEEPPMGRLLGLPDLGPGNCWVDIAGASAIADVMPKTITSWLSRGLPKHVPFPSATRISGRLYWPLTDLYSWIDEYDATRSSRTETTSSTGLAGPM